MRMICLALTLFALPALAADYYVDSAGGADTNAGTAEAPFLTLARGVQALQSNQGDRLFMTGVFREGLLVSRNGVSVIGLGDAQIEGVTSGIQSYGTGITMENILVRNCNYGLITSGSGHTYRRLRFQEDTFGSIRFPGNGQTLSTSRFMECEWYASNSVAVTVLGETANTYERCTLSGNGTAFVMYQNQSQVVIRNCILVRNDSGFVRGNDNLLEIREYNLVYENGGAGGPRNYVGFTPGANDLVQVDPLFTDEANRVYALQAGSPALNAGRDSLGNRVTIGAHEIGVLASGAAAAAVPFSSWISAGDGKPVTDGTAEVVQDPDGTLRLNVGVARAAVVSPVVDLGEEGKRVTRVDFRAFEDLDLPSGSKKVLDQDDTTFVRTFRIRGSDSAFNALDASPAWIATTNRADLSSLRKRYVQLEMTLTTQGK